MVITLFISCTEKTITEDKLQERNGVYYEVNEKNPFSGIAIEKHSDGQIEEEKKYKNGKLVSALGWDKYGQKEFEGNYRDGKPYGLHTWWYENGQKKSEGNYQNGKLDGIVIGWYENGKKKREANFKDGENISYTVWDKNGNKIENVY